MMRDLNELSRREMVRTAAGVLIVAAGGVLLPEDSNRAAALEASNDGHLGGRHGKDRRGREKHRRKDRSEKNKRQDEGPPPGRGVFEFRRTALTIKSFTDPLLAFTFYYRVKTGFDTYDPWIEDKSVTPAFGATTRFENDRFRIGVLVSVADQPGTGQIFLDVRNLTYAYPKGAAFYSYEGGLDPVRNNLGTVLMREKSFSEMSSPDSGFYAATDFLDVNFDVRRLADSDGFIEFQLLLATRSFS